MICKHCGKEIPDESLFCGYCGNKVEEEIPAEEENVVQSGIQEETEAEEPAADVTEEIQIPEEIREEAAEEALEEILEDACEEEILPSEEVINPEPLIEEEEESSIKLTLEPELEEISDAEIIEPEPVIEMQPEPLTEAETEPVAETVPEPAAEAEPEPVIADEPVTEAQPEPAAAEETASAVAEEPAPARERNLPKINIKASDFTPLLGVLKDPFVEHELGYPAAAAVFILGFIANWMAFGFGYGLLVLLVIWAGTACVLYIAKRKEFDLLKLVSVCAQLLVMPTVIMLLCGLVSLLGYSSLFVLVRLFLVFLAMMIYISALGRYTSRMNKYALAIVLAVLFAVAAACMISAFADMYISMNI